MSDEVYEVYVYDSFLQSKMYAEGVTCTDCHNPHSLNRKSEGDKVCYQCHKEEKYTAVSHHKHKEGGTGSSCISCYMPALLDENSARFSYVYAVSIGEKEPKKAIEILEKAYKKHNGNMQIVSGLVYYYKLIGESKNAEVYEKKLKALQNFSVR